MIPLRIDEVLSAEAYEREREAFRRRIIALKARRRISIGDRVTMVFENRDTMRFQVQEMVRVERIVDRAKIQDELDVYNALLPGKRELSATLFIEITESERIKEELDRFQGLDRNQTLALRAGAESVFGEFEGGHSKEDKISAVHFVKFKPSAAFIHALATSENPATVSISHPGYQLQVPVSSELRQEWLSDLKAGDE
jgi:Protein of unknown function (DUF3501)